MNHDTAANRIDLSRHKITLMMVLCGALGAAASGAANSAPIADDVPRMTLRFSPDSLATDTGARNLYHRIVRAAQEVCPIAPGTHLVTAAVAECRAQSMARAVREIGNPWLAALLPENSNHG
jgi:UrcA family protein